MQDDQSHAVEDALMNAGNDCVAHLVVRSVAPSGQHVHLRQRLLRQSMFRLAQGCYPDLEFRVGRQRGG
jgi:hypothetical protein